MKLFSTSGIRRKVSDLPPNFVVKVGLAISKAICNNAGSDVIVARDPRSSGPMLEHAICSGLISGGSNIERKGIMPTPALAYHTHKTNACAGVMLTASHNPAEYNGIKVFDKTSMGLSPNDESKIEEAFAKNDLPILSWEKFGTDNEVLGSELYNNMLLDAVSNIDFSVFKSVIADPGGGAGCEVVYNSYKELGINLVSINGMFDPIFSARPSEPEAKNLTQLIATVKKQAEKNENKTIGLAYDGDADRCVAVDEKGRYVPQDVLIALYAKYIVEQNSSKGLVITHVDASMLIDKLVVEAGGRVKRTKVGDVAIGNMVAEEKAIFGGEPCGAWIHPKYHLCPDGPLTGLKILEWVVERGPLYELVDSVVDFPVNRKKISCENELKQVVLKALDKKLSAEDDFKDILKMDGLRLNFEDDSWVLIRPSGTEPYFRVTSQAMTKKESVERLENYSKLVEHEINKAQK
ncbi:MAG: phosphoglucosamine mutase [Candidatus Heimdallarchaeota archaeon]|nr:phosphoglucosamine mutase [Candidatus Heimdallarchaeota archaeon]MBY8994583.1 phosphoglucosamine mutase [Candidatus Heimdallarchaeota archaeon]